MFFSCGEVKKHETESKSVNAKQTTSTTGTKRPRFNSPTEVIQPKEILRYWASKESYYPTLHFDNIDTLWIEFDGQCEYSFSYKLEGKNIVVYWDIIEDCTHDIGVKKSFGLKSKPIKGKPFMTLWLADDTTLQATYLFKSWTDSVNKGYNGYQYFPDLFLSCGQ
ncbi:hypothetical protein GCM10023229_18330 [Flavisolibacter ginsenosidimutans]